VGVNIEYDLTEQAYCGCLLLKYSESQNCSWMLRNPKQFSVLLLK